MTRFGRKKLFARDFGLDMYDDPNIAIDNFQLNPTPAIHYLRRRALESRWKSGQPTVIVPARRLCTPHKSTNVTCMEMSKHGDLVFGYVHRIQ